MLWSHLKQQPCLANKQQTMTGNQNNDVFQSTNSANSERRHQQNQLPPPASELSSENSGFSMVINLPTLLRALKKSSLQQQKHQQHFAEPTQQYNFNKVRKYSAN